MSDILNQAKKRVQELQEQAESGSIDQQQLDLAQLEVLLALTDSITSYTEMHTNEYKGGFPDKNNGRNYNRTLIT